MMPAVTRHRRFVFAVLVVALVVEAIQAQVALPRVHLTRPGCLEDDVHACRMNCPQQYQDPERFLCPCYSKLAQCLVQIGCSMRQKRDVFAVCTRKGYCKDGYCQHRTGDLTPRGDVRPEVFALTSILTPNTPCIDACCPGDQTCAQNASMLSVREAGRRYRKQEVDLSPRQGDPRLGVNQGYDRMPYTIPLRNIP